jgi:integrase
MQHPSNPILDTLETVPGYPATLKIYRVPCSVYYYMRVWMDGRMIPRSTKTKNKELARKAAGAFYDELLLKRAKKEPLVGGEFNKAFQAVLEIDRGRVASGERKQSMVDDAEYVFNKDLLPFFRNNALKQITYQRLLEYVTKLRERQVGNRTIKNHFIVLNKILKHGFNTGMLDKIPLFPTVSIADNPRDWLPEDQYARLKFTIDQEIKAGAVVRYKPITEELKLLTVFMVNTFLRPQDIKLLRNRDVIVVRAEKHTYLRITARGKVRVAPVVSMEAAVKVFETITAFNKRTGHGQADDFVFYPAAKSRAYAMQIMQRQFRYVLERAKLKSGADGQDRTLYSLRHTAIMYCLRNSKSINLMTLARNCRTSVEMLNRFYGAHLEAEMNIDQFHDVRHGIRRADDPLPDDEWLYGDDAPRLELDT